MVVPPGGPKAGGSGAVKGSTAVLRATNCAIAWPSSRALLVALAPPSRSKASAARLKMASATSISIRVKPFLVWVRHQPAPPPACAAPRLVRILVPDADIAVPTDVDRDQTP